MKNTRSAWLIYTVLRLLFFAVPFAVLYFLQITPWLAAIFAALIGVSLSVLLLSKPRATASESIYDWRNRDRTADDIAEDDVIAAADETADTAATQRFDQIVVGGGAMGRAAAWQLAERGQNVLLLERFADGHTNGASHGATRNFNNAYAQPHYLDLFDEAATLWQQLEESTGERLITRCGLVSHGDVERVEAAYAGLISRGAHAELISPEAAAQRWPGMQFEGAVLVSHDAGRVHAATALDVLTAEARRLGADVRFEHVVTGITEGEAGVTVTATSPTGEELSFEANGAIVTVGAWSAPLLDGVVALPPLRVTEEHPAHFAVRPELIDAAAEEAWPSFNHFRTDAAGESVASVYGMLTPGDGVKVGFHLVGAEVDPDSRAFRASDAQREELRAYVAQWFPGLDADSAEEISCTYTSTGSEDFVLDRVGHVTFGAGFSGHGFKFTPAVGRVLADAATGVASPPEPFRLTAHADPAPQLP